MKNRKKNLGALKARQAMLDKQLEALGSETLHAQLRRANQSSPADQQSANMLGYLQRELARVKREIDEFLVHP